ncbi:MAG: helix-turn-helix domain-containing protein [Nitrospinae bacterium]|nr:helix-turn-helix domain-containing protein [Nitrospinota bacterium]
MGGKFGEFFHARRIGTGSTLRQFCLEHGLDPGNISKLERGLLRPPKSPEKLGYYARLLQLTPGTPEWQKFFDLAAAERGKIPEELMEDEHIVRTLPLLFRTLRRARGDNTFLADLVEMVQKHQSA